MLKTASWCTSNLMDQAPEGLLVGAGLRKSLDGDPAPAQCSAQADNGFVIEELGKVVVPFDFDRARVEPLLDNVVLFLHPAPRHHSSSGAGPKEL
jgi:hypothetical protein